MKVKNKHFRKAKIKLKSKTSSATWWVKTASGNLASFYCKKSLNGSIYKTQDVNVKRASQFHIRVNRFKHTNCCILTLICLHANINSLPESFRAATLTLRPVACSWVSYGCRPGGCGMVSAPKTTYLCSDLKLKVVRIKWHSEKKLLSEMTHQKTLQQETVNSSSAL